MLPLFLLVVAAMVFMVGKRRDDAKIAGFAGIPIVLAIGAALTSMFVETDREALMARTIAIAETAVDPWDAEAMKGFLSPNFRFSTIDRERMEAIIDRVSGMVKINGFLTTNLMARTTQEDFGQTYLACYVDMRADLGSGNPPTQWLLDWRKIDGKWMLAEVRDAGIYGRSGIEVIDQYTGIR